MSLLKLVPILIGNWKLIEAWKVLFFVCVIMATNFLELATTLTYLGANWLMEKKLILRPELVESLGSI